MYLIYSEVFIDILAAMRSGYTPSSIYKKRHAFSRVPEKNIV
jgi:hypothetical protein